MKIKPQNTVILATSEELMNEHYYRRLWIAVKNIPITRRCWLDELADTFRDFNGIVLERSGTPYTLPLVDDVFGNDPDLRWLGYYLKPDRSGKCPNSKSWKLQRLQLLDLYFRIKYPHIAIQFNL